jgi:ubiquinone/menaquinone biosynthesis C-methylase UbiE
MNASIDTIGASTPNHHAHYPPFTGIAGAAAALSMLVARDDDARLALETTGVIRGTRLLDIGCGPGTAARMAARAGALVTAVDPAPVMLRVARLVPGQPSVTWTVGAAEDLPVADHSFDVAWSIAAVHHWDDITAGLAEVRRVVVPGGRLLAVERHVRPGATGHASHGWTDHQAELFAVACEQAGFGKPTVFTRTSGRRPVIAVTCTTT